MTKVGTLDKAFLTNARIYGGAGSFGLDFSGFFECTLMQFI
jgi:hypothetical protein